MTKSVFISYRRTDEPYAAQFIRHALCEVMPKESIFLDVERLEPGRRWDDPLFDAAAICDVMLVLIGPRWRTRATDIFDENDCVRREIATALAACKQVVPVLLEGAALPAKGSLPPDIASLPDMQGASLRTECAKADFRDLCLRAGIFSEGEMIAATERAEAAVQEQSTLVARFSRASEFLNGLALAGTGGLVTMARIANSAASSRSDNEGEQEYTGSIAGDWGVDWKSYEYREHSPDVGGRKK